MPWNPEECSSSPSSVSCIFQISWTWLFYSSWGISGPSSALDPLSQGRGPLPFGSLSFQHSLPQILPLQIFSTHCSYSQVLPGIRSLQDRAGVWPPWVLLCLGLDPGGGWSLGSVRRAELAPDQADTSYLLVSPVY